jgi:hypothetical protein
MDGLEPDNLLAFLALLGLLRSLQAFERIRSPTEISWRPRIAWDLDRAPLRPVLVLAEPRSRDQVAAAAAGGLEILAKDHDFEGRADLNHTRREARELLDRVAATADANNRGRADAVAALMSDGATRAKGNSETIEPTPLCLLFGQGHQHFLDRFSAVPTLTAPAPRGRGNPAVVLDATACIAEALFTPWHRKDQTFAFRWDPHEDVRYALMAGDPTDSSYKLGTQHGANRLAAVGLVALTVVPETRGGRVRVAVVGGQIDQSGFTLAWPIWRDPATLSAIRGLLVHPDLRRPGGLAHLGVDHVRSARRISIGKFMNFTRALPIADLSLVEPEPSGSRTLAQ